MEDFLRQHVWKKEGKQYVDLFDLELSDDRRAQLNFHVESYYANQFDKHNDDSVQQRRLGNDIVMPDSALDYYNESLRFAEENSRHVGMAYANRASCFYRLNMFKTALRDIEFAKTTQFPENLLPKLEQLERDIIEASPMEYGEQKPETLPTLSYIPNEKIPCLADVVKIKYDSKFGRHVISKYKLPANKVIMIEQDYLKTFDAAKPRSCTTCFAEERNFIACKGCADAMFCDDDCVKKSQIHKWECNTFITNIDHELKIVIHSILLAIDTFTVEKETNVNELMKFVADMWNEKLKKPKKMPKSTHDAVTKYEFFFKLESNAPIQFKFGKNFNALELVYIIFSLLTMLPKIQAAFDSVDKKRFLMHLISYHCLVININYFSTLNNLSLGIIQSLFNHSCDPNLSHLYIANQRFFITQKKTYRHRQFFISYINANLTTAQRQKMIMKSWGFECKCKLCKISIGQELANRCRNVMNVLTHDF
ncbi:SET domain and MYND-type zinc finger protein 6-like isoform X2 [Contarinia nasturtii]|nr:SET domain and MYND-type zinc finger protein 6-like isoform X2 [Contarinia nasturtii]